VSKKSVSEKKKAAEKNKRLIAIASVLFILSVAIVLAYVFFFNAGESKTWSIDGQGLLRFSYRGPVEAFSIPVNSPDDYMFEKIIYRSFGDDVYALLRIPKNVTSPPVVIVLPAASINKENDGEMAKALASMGYASMTLDERGNNGETKGTFAGDLQAGYIEYKNNGEPVQYEQAYDVLRAIDYVKTRSDVDSKNIAILGESMGGRFAIIAGALDPDVRGVIVISTSGYGQHSYADDKLNEFMKSVEPGYYLERLPPRKFVMVHFKNDTVIPVDMGVELYGRADIPKALYLYDGSVHGLYSDIYSEDLRKELKEIFGR
jgi:hypothetical protein